MEVTISIASNNPTKKLSMGLVNEFLPLINKFGTGHAYVHGEISLDGGRGHGPINVACYFSIRGTAQGVDHLHGSVLILHGNPQTPGLPRCCLPHACHHFLISSLSPQIPDFLRPRCHGREIKKTILTTTVIEAFWDAVRVLEVPLRPSPFSVQNVQVEQMRASCRCSGAKKDNKGYQEWQGRPYRISKQTHVKMLVGLQKSPLWASFRTLLSGRITQQ